PSLRAALPIFRRPALRCRRRTGPLPGSAPVPHRPGHRPVQGQKSGTLIIFSMPEQDSPSPSSGNARAAGSLQAIGLGKTFGRRAVVQDVSLSVDSGEVVGLLGPNGAGKTTSFYMIVGLIPADTGRILIDKHEVTGIPMHRRARLGLSYLPQDASVFRRLTVEQNIRAVLELQRDEQGRPLSSATLEERLESLIDELQIEHIRRNMAISLSGGERRRVEIA